MKFTVFLQDPDGFYDSMRQAAENYVNEHFSSADEDEKEALIDSRLDKMKDFISTWVEFGENIGIEFDTEACTATVVRLQ